MAEFGKALADVYQKPENKSNNETKSEKKGARKKIKVTHDASERPSSTYSGFYMGRKELCMEITSVLSEFYSDYIGCNFVITPDGHTELFALFGPEVKNPNAPYRAFEPNIREGKASSIKVCYEQHNKKFCAYTPTQDGIDTLSDLLNAGNNQKDNEGRVKNFNNYWSENSSYQTNGQQIVYGVKVPVYAKVVLDMDRVLRVVWPKADISDQYQYNVVFTNYYKFNDSSDWLLSVTETSRKEANKVLQFVGAVPRDVNVGGNVEVY